jgi:general nucleoside transport system permease protein
VKESSKRSAFLDKTIDLLLSGGRPILAIVLALLVSAILIWVAGANPIKAYAAMLEGSIGSLAAIANMGVRASPLILGGLGAALCLKAGLLNVGTEGQIYAGAIGATAIGILPLPVPGWLHMTLALVMAFIAGGIWGIVPGYLKAYRGISEVVISLMMNYIGIYLASYLVHEPQPLAQKDSFFPMSPPIVADALLPKLIKGTSLHAGIILGILLCIVVYLILRYTTFGFRTRLVGANLDAARFSGIQINRHIMLVIVLGSALGGLAGAGEVLGLKERLYDFFAGGVGYEAVAVALLANGNPLGVILAGLFFGALKAGANKMQTVVGIATPMAMVIQALCVLFVIGIGLGERAWRAKKEKATKETREKVEDHAVQS